MIILTSSGLNSEKLLLEVKKHLKPDMKKSAIITTASVGYKEKDWHIPRIKEELKRLNLVVDFFDVEFQDPSGLLEFDVILINGGNPFYLQR